MWLETRDGKGSGSGSGYGKGRDHGNIARKRGVFGDRCPGVGAFSSSSDVSRWIGVYSGARLGLARLHPLLPSG